VRVGVGQDVPYRRKRCFCVHTIRRLYYHISLNLHLMEAGQAYIRRYLILSFHLRRILHRLCWPEMRPHLAIQSHEILPGIRSQGLARPALKEVSDWLSLQRGAFLLHLGPSSIQSPGPTRTLKIANHSYYLLLSRRYRLFHCDTCAFLTQPFAPLSVLFTSFHPPLPIRSRHPSGTEGSSRRSSKCFHTMEAIYRLPPHSRSHIFISMLNLCRKTFRATALEETTRPMPA
jgi:hypothetical protein